MTKLPASIVRIESRLFNFFQVTDNEYYAKNYRYHTYLL